MAVASVTGGFVEKATAPMDAPSHYLGSGYSIARANEPVNDRVSLTAPLFGYTANTVIGSQQTITSFDFSVARRLIYAEVSHANYLSTWANGGGLILEVSAGSYNAAWAVLGGDGTQNDVSYSQKKNFVIRATKTNNALTAHASYNAAAITKMAVGGRGVAAYFTLYFHQIGYVDPYVLINGTSGAPGKFSDISAKMDTQNVTPLISPTKNIHLCKVGFIIGNGSTATYFVDSIKTWEFVNDRDTSIINKTQCHVDENDIGFEINASASDHVELTLFTFIGLTKFFWNVLGSSSAVISFNTGVVQNAGAMTIIDGPTFEAVIFDSCDMINATAPTLNNCIIKNSTDPAAIKVTDTENITNTRIFGNTTGMLFDFVGSATLNMDNIVFTGNTYDVTYTGNGVLTLVLTNGSSISTTHCTGSGSIVLAGELVEQGLSFTGLLADSQVIIYETGTTTIIDSDSSSGTSFEWKETYSADQTVDYTILKEGYLPIRVTGLALSTSVVPVLAQQVADRTYAASSGLTYGTSVVINTSAKTVAVSANTTGQNLRNALIEFWRAQTALRNVKFPAVTNGPNSITMIDGWELTSGSITYLSRDGLRYTNSSDVTTATWAAILSIGSVVGLTAEYQQVSAAAPTDAKASGVVDQLIQIYGDATHGNYDRTGYLYIKYQSNGYAEAGLNVVDQYGTLEDQLYVVGIQPTALADFTTGNPSITGVTITNHGASPQTWNGKAFSLTITDTGGNTGEAIWRWINYNKSLDATFQGEQPFNLFDMVVNAGGTYETQRGTIIGSAGAALKGVRVVDGSGDPHSYFARFQADDGTYYVPPAQILLEAPNLLTGRVRLYNETTLTEIDNSLVTGAYNFGWVNGSGITAGDVVTLTWASDLGDKDVIESTFVAPATGGVTIIDTPVNDVVFLSYTGLLGVGGADITEFIPDFPNLQLDINAGPGFKVMRMYIFYKWILSSETGIQVLVGAITPIDAGKLLIDVTKVPFNLDSLAAYNVYQEDSVVIIRSDGAPVPVSQPTGGYGISMIHNGTPVVFSTSDGLSVSDYNLINSIAANQYTNTLLHTGLNSYANKNDWKASVTGLATQADLAPLATSAELAGIAQTSDLTPLAKTTDLVGLALTTDLASIATSAQVAAIAIDQTVYNALMDAYPNKASYKANVSGLAVPADLAGIAQSSELVPLARTSELEALATTLDLAPLAKTSDLAGLATAANLTSNNAAAAAAVFASVIENGETFAQVLRLLRAANVGNVEDDGAGNVVIRSANGTTARIAATYDQDNGSRTIVSTNAA